MAIFKSGNPTLTQKMFDKSMHIEANMQGTMSVRGAINKFGFLMLMVVAGAAYSWHLFEQGQPGTMYTLMITGAIG
ncbi:MAG: Bax inhibitor/YccA family protein [Sediminibacterium sp.]|nr:Bax inhibitor/YccA family protein [Sediminibacterium sp.]